MPQLFAHLLNQRRLRLPLGLAVALLAYAVGFAALTAAAPKPSPLPDKKQSRVRIELTGGANQKPIPDASVYLKFSKDAKSEKGKLIELNIKTNLEGIAQSPEIPQGKILIQIVAEGWKTYGEWHEVTQDEQTIPIHLDRPTSKWY
jgi:hypothetical protein